MLEMTNDGVDGVSGRGVPVSSGCRNGSPPSAGPSRRAPAAPGSSGCGRRFRWRENDDPDNDRGTGPSRRGERSGRGGAVIRVLLADDEHLVRRAIATLLGLEPDVEVVAEVARGDLVAAAVLEHRPDVVVLDIEMPGMDGLSVAETLPGHAVLMLTSFGRPGYLRRALAAGVRGFVPKDASADELATAIRKVHAGGRYLDPEMAASAMMAGRALSPSASAAPWSWPRGAPRSPRSPPRSTSPRAPCATTCPAPSPNWARPTGSPRSGRPNKKVGFKPRFLI